MNHKTNRPCEWLHITDTCEAGPNGERAEAVHRVKGVRLCGFHSPYDNTPENAERFPLEDTATLKMREELSAYTVDDNGAIVRAEERMRTETLHTLEKVDAEGARMLGVVEGSWVHHAITTNASIVPEHDEDGNVSGVLDPGILVVCEHLDVHPPIAPVPAVATLPDTPDLSPAMLAVLTGYARGYYRDAYRRNRSFGRPVDVQPWVRGVKHYPGEGWTVCVQYSSTGASALYGVKFDGSFELYAD